MDTKLFCQAIVKFISGLILVGVLLFLPAGSFAYWQGWLLIGILFVPMFVAGLVMMKKSPELLRKRRSSCRWNCSISRSQQLFDDNGERL